MVAGSIRVSPIHLTPLGGDRIQTLVLELLLFDSEFTLLRLFLSQWHFVIVWKVRGTLIRPAAEISGKNPKTTRKSTEYIVPCASRTRPGRRRRRTCSPLTGNRLEKRLRPAAPSTFRTRSPPPRGGEFVRRSWPDDFPSGRGPHSCWVPRVTGLWLRTKLIVIIIIIMTINYLIMWWYEVSFILTNSHDKFIYFSVSWVDVY